MLCRRASKISDQLSGKSSVSRSINEPYHIAMYLAQQKNLSVRRISGTRRLFANMVHCRENSFLICKSFDQHKELAAPLIDRVELGLDNIVRIHWSFGGTACLGAGVGG